MSTSSVVLNVLASVVMTAAVMFSAPASAKGGGSHEMGISYRYDSAKSPTKTYSTHELQIFHLVPVNLFWAGVEFDYANNKNPDYGSSLFELGGLAKYWIVDPGGTVGFNLFAGVSFGKEDTGSDPHSTFTMKAGPEIAWFIWEGAAISTRLQYAARRAGPNYTIVGLNSGVSLFF